MAKVTITIEDTKQGGSHVMAEFCPTPNSGEPWSNAQLSAAWMMNALNAKLGKDPIFKINE